MRLFWEWMWRIKICFNCVLLLLLFSLLWLFYSQDALHSLQWQMWPVWEAQNTCDHLEIMHNELDIFWPKKLWTSIFTLFVLFYFIKAFKNHKSEGSIIVGVLYNCMVCVCTQWDYTRMHDMEKHIPSLWRHKNYKLQLSNSGQSLSTAKVFLKQKYIFSIEN